MHNELKLLTKIMITNVYNVARIYKNKMYTNKTCVQTLWNEQNCSNYFASKRFGTIFYPSKLSTQEYARRKLWAAI